MPELGGDAARQDGDDPYAVVADGQIYWMLDAYTYTAAYPYSQPIFWQPGGIRAGGIWLNYIRNSVKIVVNAYDGSIRFYVADPNDPIFSTFGESAGVRGVPAAIHASSVRYSGPPSAIFFPPPCGICPLALRSRRLKAGFAGKTRRPRASAVMAAKSKSWS